ncbi:MAG: adenylate/guanylate cyclase domain-containing response regulator [Planctomycetaceae bacterium]|nr:MAG: adenylate/guanylate cyclase domain-containing response regulator [Planctomycetaceae bacterium]
MTGLLIVDDEEGVRRSLKKVLVKDGYNILLAENGMEAINIVQDNWRDIETVISDFKMPGIDGLETLIEIGSINPEITRIMLTGYATMESAIHSVNAGIDGFLTKPFENIELRAKVREYNIEKRLKQFVSEQILTELQKEGKNIVPRKQRVSILFSDIRGFTEISEKMSPLELSDMLNSHYFSPLDNIIFEYNGTLDKHIGDSIMGIFGAPISYDDDALRAVKCAIRMREEMAKINKNLSKIDKNIPVGIGISTGEAMVGIFGSPQKKEYTVFGSSVNLAARLERHAKKDQILICDETYGEVQDSVKVESMDTFDIKGIERKINVFEVIEELQKNS